MKVSSKLAYQNNSPANTLNELFSIGITGNDTRKTTKQNIKKNKQKQKDNKKQNYNENKQTDKQRNNKTTTTTTTRTYYVLTKRRGNTSYAQHFNNVDNNCLHQEQIVKTKTDKQRKGRRKQ